MTRREKLKQILKRAKFPRLSKFKTSDIEDVKNRLKTTTSTTTKRTVPRSSASSCPAISVPWGAIGTVLFYLVGIAVLFGIVCFGVVAIAQVIPFFMYFFSGLGYTAKFICTNPLALIVFVVGIIVIIKVQLF
jgi:hypothetical protein